MASIDWRRLWSGVSDLWRGLRERQDVQRALTILRYALFAGVVIYLIFRLSSVGWGQVFGNLPSSNWFYVFFILRFLVLPVSELAIYEIVWQAPLLRHFLVFVRKRVYNFAVMGYSGEAFLTLWARRRLALSDKSIIVGVKDNNLLSALTSNIATVLLIFFLAATGGLRAGLEAFPGAGALFAIAFLTAGTLAVLVIVFRQKLIALPPGVMPVLLGLHGVRQAMIIALTAAMYSAALPGAPLQAWLIFIAMQLVLSRIPFLPNQEVVYLTAALTMAPIVGMPEAAVAGMLVAEAGLSQIFNAVLFAATAPLARSAKSS
ncbi:MAG: hypothetical protein AAFW81_08420 [Pseudomonadota bacterium]